LVRIAALAPTDVYRATSIYLADNRHRSLAHPGEPRRYSLRPETPVVVVAETAGAPWRASADDVDFTIRDHDGLEQHLAGRVRTRERLGSVTWSLELPDRGAGFHDYYLRAAVNHPARGRQLLKEERVEIELL